MKDRTFSHSIVACGSMVLCPYCMSFFRPAERKNDIQRMKHCRQAKALKEPFLLYMGLLYREASTGGSKHGDITHSTGFGCSGRRLGCFRSASRALSAHGLCG